ncbi:MAG: hypothetical protein KDD42_00595 [Bdellovibrionales bacterium]|nr:hypothetical protein [Bdellovibrionales bacterium]
MSNHKMRQNTLTDRATQRVDLKLQLRGAPLIQEDGYESEHSSSTLELVQRTADLPTEIKPLSELKEAPQNFESTEIATTLSGPEVFRSPAKIATKLRKFGLLFLGSVCVTAGVLYVLQKDLDLAMPSRLSATPPIAHQAKSLISGLEAPNNSAIKSNPIQTAIIAESSELNIQVGSADSQSNSSIEAKLIRPEKFDPLKQAEKASIDLGNRSFTFVNEPRNDLSGNYNATQSLEGGANSQLGRIGLRPVQNSNARYVSPKSNLEWQGGWELSAPHRNLERGTDYLKYLQKKFNGNVEGPLISVERGKSSMVHGLKSPEISRQAIKKYSD